MARAPGMRVEYGYLESMPLPLTLEGRQAAFETTYTHGRGMPRCAHQTAAGEVCGRLAATVIPGARSSERCFVHSAMIVRIEACLSG